MRMLDREFYNRDSLIVAKELLGKVLVHEINGQRISAKIVETEAYMGVSDKAAHSYGGRRTPRVEVMYGRPGVSYVFFIYGMHNCFNIVTQEEGNPQAVLIRAVEPVEGLDLMAQNRFGKAYNQLSKSQSKSLTNGPGKLCQALAIDRSLNGEDLCGGRLYVREGETEELNIVSAKRIGIDYAEEAKDYLWRFYINDNKFVSVK
jgi:DNA-3-methyladenine glycosylase